MRIHYIYRVTNNINNKIYIGQTVSPKSRWQWHLWSAKAKRAQAIHHALKKYGMVNFSFEIIVCCLDQNAANQAEIQLIAEYNSTNSEYGYNVAPGGLGRSGFHHSAETRQKMSKALKGRKLSPEHIQKLADSKKGRKLSEEHKSKLSCSGKGKNTWAKSQIVSSETKEKISKSLKGRKKPERTEQHKRKLGCHKGKTWKIVDGKRIWLAK